MSGCRTLSASLDLLSDILLPLRPGAISFLAGHWQTQVRTAVRDLLICENEAVVWLRFEGIS